MTARAWIRKRATVRSALALALLLLWAGAAAAFVSSANYPLTAPPSVQLLDATPTDCQLLDSNVNDCLLLQ
jgi:hypothetical protein